MRHLASALAVGAIFTAVVLVDIGARRASPVRTGQPPVAAHLTYDEQLATIAEQVPSFAGLYVDGDTYVIKATDGTLASAQTARRRAADILDRPELAAARIRAEPAEFSWTQLMRWYQAISKRVWEVADVTSTDIDEKHNIIRIGVSNLDQHEPAVRALAEGHGVPTAALEVIEREAIKPLMDERYDR